MRAPAVGNSLVQRPTVRTRPLVVPPVHYKGKDHVEPLEHHETKHRQLPPHRDVEQDPSTTRKKERTTSPLRRIHIQPTGVQSLQGRPKRMLLVVDGNADTAVRGLHWSLANMYAPGDKLRILQVLPHSKGSDRTFRLPGGRSVSLASSLPEQTRLDEALHSRQELDVQEAVREMLQRVQVPFEFEVMREADYEGTQGVAKHVCSEAAEWNASLTVLPRVRNGKFEDQFVGAVAEHVASQSPTPVVLLHEKELGLPPARPRALSFLDTSVSTAHSLSPQPHRADEAADTEEADAVTSVEARTLMIAVDLESPAHASKALAFTLDNLYREHSDVVRLVHVISATPGHGKLIPSAESESSLGEQEEYLEMRHIIQTTLGKVLDEYDVSSVEVDIVSNPVEGNHGHCVGTALCELADELSATFLVVSSHHPHKPSQYLQGSISSWVSHFAGLCVVVYR